MDSRTNALIGIVVSLGLLTVSDKATVGTEAPLSTDAYHGRAILFYPHDLEQSGRITLSPVSYTHLTLPTTPYV